MTPFVTMQGVSRLYRVGQVEVGLRAADISIDRSDFVTVMGPSGSGKSTLLNLLGLLDRPTSGTIRFGAVDVSSLTESQRAALRGQRIGFVFQSFHLLPYRTALENVTMAMLYNQTPRKTRRERAAAALASVGLERRLSSLPNTMSGGERQRVAIARAIVSQPHLLLCDEPTGNLDSQNAAKVLQLLRNLSGGGLTTVLITHDPEVAAVGRRRLRLVDGHLTEHKDPEHQTLDPAHVPRASTHA